MLRQLLSLTFALLLSQQTLAWGKRGHEMVGSLAAQLLAQEYKPGKFLINHSFDMGYYNNVPDLVWKPVPETYKKEFSQHFTDMEIFERAFKKSNKVDDWSENRAEFFKKYPDIENRAGRSLWRIQEFMTQLSQITDKLKESSKKNKNSKEHQALQEQWLVTAGLLGHYVADLSQPLHVTENHDGQMSGQKGLHHWFEETLVDDLYPQLSTDVYARAKKLWPEFLKSNQNKTPFQITLELAKNSSSQIPALLALDKKNGRKDSRKVALANQELLVERLSLGVLNLALLWSKNLDWSYNGDKFFNFVPAPVYVEPPGQ